MKRVTLFCLIAFILLISSCVRNKNCIRVNLEEIHTIGKLEGSDEDIFGRIQDFCFDNENKLYVLDSDYLTIRIYDINGNRLHMIGGQSGHGPGEFLFPVSIDVDSLKNIYIADQRRGDVTVLDSSGRVLKIIRVKRLTCIINVGNPFEIYGLAHPGLHRKPLIQKYNLVNDLVATPAQYSFCDRQTGADSVNIVQSGFFGDICINNDMEVFYAFPYPYEIRRFTSDGKIISIYKRNVSFFKSPKEISGVTRIPTGIQQIMTYSDSKYRNIIICKYYKRAYGKLSISTTFYFDFWDVDSGELLGTFSDSELNLKGSDWIQIDEECNLYASYQYEFPHIVKYKMTINEK